ncbi:MAG: DUF3413 domain-containing protein [Pasteurellaceae bacterium]|nr:DUF3413 domain-containing protein [Pasteurellaceae bacterium]
MFGIKTSRQYRELTSQKISWGHWFAFFNIIWAILIGSRYAFIIDWPYTLFGKIYFFISLLGHFSFITFALYLLILFPLSFIIKNERTFRGISVIFATISTTLLLVDTEVFARFNLHLSSVVWNLLVNPENGELARHWQLFFTPMPLMLLVQMLFSRWAWYRLRSLERQKWIRGLGLFLTGMFIATHLIYTWADAYIYRPITMQKSNFPLSYPMTAVNFLEKNGILNKDEYENRLEQEGRVEAPRINYPKNPLTFAENASRPNILLINISGLRNDALSDNVPNLQQFAHQATRFTHHYSTGNTNNAGLTGLFYGLTANYTDSLLSNRTPSVLIQHLQQQGYQFGLFSANNFNDSLFKQALFKKINGLKGQQSNQTAIQQWATWFKTQDNSPWFSYLDLDLITPTKNLHSKTLAQEQQDYQQQLALLDNQLATIFTQFTDTQAQNTLVILTAEHGYAYQLTKKEQQNYFARDEIQVPMWVQWKTLPIGDVTKLSSHTDLLPALMKHIFKANNPTQDYSQGIDLFNLSQSDPWVLAANHRWNVIITPDDTQYHIDNKGNYQKFDRNYQVQSSNRPPLGLFLDAFNRNKMFFEK